ncbi:MAG: 6-pyruvoyl-tetrahydropterin synthase-related protein, partial [Actinomycetota bacterium]|nr:6-pyruvoyl-tetrahydropterin synthase-related protein [Actinomycetota bacterium]
APDWYAGFPAYHFYMVLPSLAIVALDVVLPYNVAFKLVTVSGLLALPVAAWALGRLARLPFPGPALLAVATVPFLFDRSFTIYGGNVASTLAGEFAFSISLALAVVFLGLVLRGLETGRHRVSTAVVLALCALSHVIPAIFAAVGALLALGLHADRSRLRWLAPTGVVGALLTAFWTVPFVLRRPYLNDMGWEKLTSYWESLLPGRLGSTLTRALGNEATADIAGDMTWVALLAAVGVVTSLLFRRRLGILLALLALAFAVGFLVAPQGRLWNARLLPFWYLCLHLLAAVAVSELASSLAAVVARRPERPVRAVVLGVPVAATVAVLVVVGLPLRSLPFGSTSADGTYRWAGLSTTDRSFIPDWADWNYSGYEGKAAYPEFRSLLATMADVGEDRGCGRAMWEYDSDLDRFGTPMALMLLPYATDGCIGSMEGLYFEASATTPFHFLNQSELSTAPSRAQRDLPYGNLDVAAGVDHLQLLGVRYYLAFSPEAVAQADASPDLTPVATSGSWRVYEVAGTELVEPLTVEPAVLEGVAAGGKGWLDPAVEWYLDPSAREVLLAASGPPSWQRVRAGERPELRSVPDARVSAVEASVDRLSFRVDRPGTPVLVKASYFPNWEADGAEGPWRVTPNLMVVVPTATEVELRYGTTPVEWLAWALTAVGVAGLIVLARRGPVPLAVRRPEDHGDGRGATAAEAVPVAEVDDGDAEAPPVLVPAGAQESDEGGPAAPGAEPDDDPRPGAGAGGGPPVQPVSPPVGRIWGPPARDTDSAG